MSTPSRVILHVDMDAFFVSVELRRHPELVAAASYEARRYGVHSALPSVTARRLCPQAVFLPGDHALYAQVSAEVNRIFHTVTPLVEPLSLDEAFLDVTGAVRLLGAGAVIAARLRQAVFDELQLRCSVGIAPNKFLAKLASVAAKPRATADGVHEGAGVLEVRPGTELDFLHPLPVRRLWGVGPATLEKLVRLGVHTVGDLAALGEPALITALGASQGRHLHRLAWALDDRDVDIDRETKSIGHEETFATDRYTHDALGVELVRLADGVATRLRSHGGGARTLTLKVRFAGFDTITRAVALPGAVATAHAIRQAAESLLCGIDPSPGVRLLGISVSNFAEIAEQLSLDDLFVDDLSADRRSSGSRGAPTSSDWQAAEDMVNAIRGRFGSASIGPASAVGPNGMRLVRRGSQQWGPDDDRAKG
jgi:DNA polymerase-4